MKKFTEIQLIPSFKGQKKGDVFTRPARYFGRDCTVLYKIHGFEIEGFGCWIYASRIDKRTGRIPNWAPIFERFKFQEP